MGGPVILTVALNAALDVTYHLDGRVTPYATHRVASVEEAAGGKALNTARILHTFGEPVVASGLVGGTSGERIVSLVPPGLRHRFEHIAGSSRRALVVADSDDATGFWEPGPTVTAREWDAFRRRFSGLAKLASIVVLSGSLPPGLDDDAYAQLVRLAARGGATTILDCDGAPLHAALAARPDVIKPNATELAEAVPGVPLDTEADVVAAASKLREAGAGAVVASLGGDGLVAVTEDGAWAAAPPRKITGNPTGAGDACVAGIARGIRHRQSWPDLLRDAVALSAASVLAPIAGHVDVRDYLRLRHDVKPTPALKTA